jgi:hypothetical protein
MVRGSIIRRSVSTVPAPEMRWGSVSLAMLDSVHDRGRVMPIMAITPSLIAVAANLTKIGAQRSVLSPREPAASQPAAPTSTPTP